MMYSRFAVSAHQQMRAKLKASWASWGIVSASSARMRHSESTGTCVFANGRLASVPSGSRTMFV